MSIQLTVQLDAAPVRGELDRIRQRKLHVFRERLTRSVAVQAVSNIAARQSVDSGRTKQAWTSILNQLAAGGSSLSSDRDGSVEHTAERDATAFALRNNVEYLEYVEYGTRYIEPRRIVAGSLTETILFVGSLATAIFQEEFR